MKGNCLRSVIVVLSAATMLAFGRAANAEDPNAILDLLEHKGIITHDEAQQARTYYDKQQKDAVVKYDKTKVSSWIDEMKWSGDLRLRAQYLSPEDDLNKPDRLRWRLRLRTGADMKLQDWADVGFRLISGETSPGNSLSGNTTFSNTFQKKPIGIDLAYATIHPPQLPWVQATGGKINPPIWSPTLNSPMIYDPDLTVEGAGEMLQYKFGDKQQHKLFANFGEYAAKEFSTDSNDSYVFDFQGGVQAKSERVTLTLAGGYFFTHNVDNPNFAVGDTSNTGNSVKAGAVVSGKTNSVVLADFNVLYGAGEVAWQVRDQPLLGTPFVVKVGGMYLDNIKSAFGNDPAGNDTKGWTGQITLGDAKSKGNWMVAYQYKHLEANATWDAITDDDYGNGGTDRKGHVIKAAYNVKDWWQLGFTAFITEKISSLSNRPNSGHNQVGVPGEDQLHLYVDSMFKF
jgi:hypothetical protein